MISRNIDETKFEYGLRLIEAKMEGSPDVEWQDIVDVLNLDIHRDTLRKACQGEFGSYNVLKYLKEKYAKSSNVDSEILDELELKIIEGKKERKKLQTLSLEYNKMLREQARDEMIVETLRDIIPECPAVIFEPLQIGNTNKEWVLTFGDIHFDKFYESVNNSYSTDEIKRRFDLLLTNVIYQIEKEGITHLNIINSGDSLEGLLRVSALRTMRHGMMQSVVMVSRFIGDWLNTLSKNVTITYRHVETANHSELRLFNQKRGETDENLELIIVNYIHDYVRFNERIEVPVLEQNYIPFKIFNYNLIALHGDQIKNVETALKDLSQLHRVFYDYVIMGHYHSGKESTVAEGETNDKEYIIVPSIVGSDPYSDTLMRGSKSSALLLEFTEGQGLVGRRKFILN